MSPTLFLSCFAVYVVAITVFGAWISRRNKSGDEFLLGGRSLPFFLTLGTTIATMVGTGSSMGAVGKGYSFGWMGSFFGIGSFVGVLLIAVLFASVRRHNFMTMTEELSSYVGGSQTVSILVAVFTYLASVGWLGAHILGGGFYLQYVTGIDPSLAMILIALGFAVYSSIGGYRAVVWTDTIQAVVLFFGFVLTAYYAYRSVGGIEGLQQVHAELTEKGAVSGASSFMAGFSLILASVVSVLATPSFRQRIYSGNSVGEIRRAFICSALLASVFCILPSIIGMAAYRNNPGLDKPDLAFPFMATEMLPLTIGVITLLAGLSATMSSASSDAIAGVTVLVRDIHEMILGRVPDARNVVLISRIGLGVTAGLALLLALAATDIIDYIKDMVAMFITGMAVVGILGKFWPRFNAWGAVTAMVVAFTTALTLAYYPSLADRFGGSIVPTLAASVILSVLVSLMTRPDELSQSEMVEVLAQRRAAMSDKD